jgi:non-specific serine/threonine protein kinase
MSGLGLIEGARGNYGRATALLEESLALERATGDTVGLASTLRTFGRVMLWQGNHERAMALYQESLILLRTIGTRRVGIAMCLEGLAAAAVMQEQPERAARLFGAAEALRDTIHAPLPPTYRADYDRQMSHLRARLEETALTAAWAEGRAMTIEEAIECALEPGAPPTTKLSAQPAVGKGVKILTQREREVATLIAQGLTNREIASRLVVAERTAEGHVQSILNKLGFNSRAQIAAWAVAQGLLAVS